MNEQSLNALTTPEPTDRDKIARYLAALCAVRYPHLTRPKENYVWAELLNGVLNDPNICGWAVLRDRPAWRRLVAIVIDLWGYYLDNPDAK